MGKCFPLLGTCKCRNRLDEKKMLLGEKLVLKYAINSDIVGLHKMKMK